MIQVREPLTHDLSRHYEALRRIRRRRDLLRTLLWAEIGTEIERLLDGIERGEHAQAHDSGADRLRVVAWNIQRGMRFDGMRRAFLSHPVLHGADVLLLSEVDCGMARSGNRNVARELAEALSMNYVFAPSYLALEDDYGENREGRPSTLALAGTAILSRAPIRRAENVDLPELRDKFSSSEKRLGKKRALLAEIELAEGPLLCGACHLDSNASPRQRAQQLDMLLGRARSLGVPRILIGGDMNTTTYDASGLLPLFRDLCHKLFVTGFRQTVEQYMTPELRYERPVFATLATHGFQTEGFNDRARGTYHYDLNSDYAIQKVRKRVGRLLTWLLQRRLRPWGGIVPARLDWFAGSGLTPASATVADARDDDGRPVSDHAAIVVDLPRTALRVTM